MNKLALWTLLAGTATACSPLSDADPVVSPVAPPFLAEHVRLDLFTPQGPMVLQGERLERQDNQGRLIITRNASLSLLGPSTVRAEADRIETQLNRQTVTLTGHVRSRFSYSLTLEPQKERLQP